jgi:biopolymer transport protein ExbD
MPLKVQLEETPPLNLTAMLDVMFLLIIFFALNTKFLDEERQIEVRVPHVTDRGNLASAPQSKVVNIARDGTITLNQTRVTLDELTARLESDRARSGAVGVVVRGDAHGEFQQVAAVLNACKQAGISDLGISVRLSTVRR